MKRTNQSKVITLQKKIRPATPMIEALNVILSHGYELTGVVQFSDRSDGLPIYMTLSPEGVHSLAAKLTGEAE